MKHYIYTLYLSIVALALIVAIVTACSYVSASSSAKGVDFAATIESAKAPSVAMLAPQKDSLEQQLSLQPDSAPTLTIVPVMGADYTSVDTLKRDSACINPTTRAQRRACRARDFAFHIDSLVESRSFAFYPTSMQAAPKGMIRMIYAEWFYIYVSPVDLEVHLPVERGFSQYVTMLNFDADNISNYAASKYLSEWRITFSSRTAQDIYYFDLIISTVTGESLLLVQNSHLAMRYVGSVGVRLKEAEESRGERMRQRLATAAQEVGEGVNPAATN